jgi:hypothetical protein
VGVLGGVEVGEHMQQIRHLSATLSFARLCGGHAHDSQATGWRGEVGHGRAGVVRLMVRLSHGPVVSCALRPRQLATCLFVAAASLFRSSACATSSGVHESHVRDTPPRCRSRHVRGISPTRASPHAPHVHLANGSRARVNSHTRHRLVAKVTL